MQLNVLEYLEKGALVRCPRKVAVVDCDRRHTFEDLERFAKNCAALILRHTAAINQPVAVFLRKSTQTIVADLGILYSGNCYANLDLKSPPERLKAILQTLGNPLIITSAADTAVLRGLGVPEERLLLVETGMTAETAYDNGALLARVERVIDTDPVYIMFTSGSTGVPKGVVIPHRGVIDYIDWAKDCYRISEAETLGNQAPFFFDNSTLDIYLCLSCGATLALIPDELFAFPKKLVDYVRQAGITTVFWVPSVLTNVANLKILDKTELPALSKILFAGEVMPTRTLTYWREKFPQALFSNLYGPTEITVDCTYYIVDRDFADSEKLPIGFPCRNTDILILNEQNRPAAVNEPGELCVRGSSLALGYWNNPEQTARAFTQNPLNTRYPEIIYRTGDLVFRNERGEIMFMGRKDYQVKHLGYRIELAEIETAVTAIPEILNACVLYHHARKEITLFFESQVKLLPGDIRKRLTERLPKYMLPTVFIQLDAMPRNPNGKVDRKWLTETYLKNA
jgi:amino acid adenylation domain-containing protein